MHRQILREFIRTALQADQRTDPRAVQIGTEQRRGAQARETPNGDVLADLGDQRASSLLDAPTLEPAGEQGVQVRRCGGERKLGHRGCEALKFLAAGDEVGLAVDLEEHRVAALARDRDGAFGGHSLGLLVGLGKPGLAHQFGGGIEIAGGLDERLLALHHSGAGALAQLLDGFGGNVHQVFL